MMNPFSSVMAKSNDLADGNRFLLRPIQARSPSFRIRDKPTSDPHVDVVITWHCENIGWIKDIDLQLSAVTTIVLLHKIDESDLTKPGCSTTIPESSLEIVYVRLPNKGRDTHSPFAYISNHYESLSSFTIFLQADRHWIIDNDWIPSALGFKTNANALNHFIPLVLETKPAFLPVMPIIDGEPIFFVDRDSNDNKEAQDKFDPPTLKKFDACSHDISNRVRETHRILFGTSPCSFQTFPFVPGFQFIVRRDQILARPKAIWDGIEKMAYDGCEDFGYVLERLSINLFNSTDEVVVSPDAWEVPLYCRSEGKPYFNEPFDALLAQDFWTKYWKCQDDEREHNQVVGKKMLRSVVSVSCGAHSAKRCSDCPNGQGKAWCNGDCEWNDSTSKCENIPSHLHPSYINLVQNRPFQPVIDEYSQYVNVILVRSPFETKEQEAMYERYKDEILFLGIMSHESYPLLSPNPWSPKFTPEDYTQRFPGWLNMYRDNIFPEDIPITQISHSDFSLVPDFDYDAEVLDGKHEKKYDFIYVMTNTELEVESGCTGWGSFAKNWVRGIFSSFFIFVGFLQQEPNVCLSCILAPCKTVTGDNV